MSLKEKLFDSRVSRRSFLKGMAAVGTTAALYGCGSGGDGAASYQPVVGPSADLEFDHSVTEVSHGHHVHCGGSCVLKLHVKNNRVLKITSAGDISVAKAKENAERLFAHNDLGIAPGVWGNYEAADESLAPIQRRCCLKGLSEVKRIYAPDRLKYPMIQTKERGDLTGFKRISWGEAIETIARWMNEIKAKKEELGYLPILDMYGSSGISPYLGHYVTTYGNTSYGNLVDAWFAALGPYNYQVADKFYQGQPAVQGNPAIDMLNSKFIINWSNDHRVTRNQLPFYMIKAKEAGIPIVTIDARHTDTVSSMSTGIDDVPPLVSVRSGTDSALQVAMANVIYRKNLHDEAFIREYCFGFYPKDSVVSQSLLHDPVTGEDYAGKTFTVPDGESFVEYLDQLESDHGGYDGVLNWASKLTGVPAKVIESLAIKYATLKPAFIYSSYNGGAQRTNNGMYYSWMLIALSAMTGNLNKRGGGPGEVRLGDGYRIKLGPAPASTNPSPAGSGIAISQWHIGDVILTGRDHRTAEQLRSDVQLLNGVDLGEEGKIKIEMIYRGGGDFSLLNQSPSLSKNLLAYKKVKYIVAHELVLSPDAAMADIVLPVTHNFEKSYFTYRYTDDLFACNGPVTALYETKHDWEISQLVANALGLNMDRGDVTDVEIMETQWSGASIPSAYKEIDPDATLPSFEKAISEADLQLTVPLEKTVIDLASYKPGHFTTDTGKINFYSPYLASRARVPLGAYRAQYVRATEGYEDIMENGGKVGDKGIKYTLQFITPHILQRAHSQYENVAVLKDKLPQVVWMHPKDAGARGINDGDIVYVFNDVGCIKLPVELTKRVRSGMVAIGEGAWYRASKTETYEAWFDTNGDGVAEKHSIPVDVGGNVNSLTKGMATGAADPLIPGGYGFTAGGNLCEVSKTHPDSM